MNWVLRVQVEETVRNVVVKSHRHEGSSSVIVGCDREIVDFRSKSFLLALSRMDFSLSILCAAVSWLSVEGITLQVGDMMEGMG